LPPATQSSAWRGLTTRPAACGDSPVSSDRTRALLGWAPAHTTLLEDMETGDYFAAQPA
jgi:hypothetical protein